MQLRMECPRSMYTSVLDDVEAIPITAHFAQDFGDPNDSMLLEFRLPHELGWHDNKWMGRVYFSKVEAEELLPVWYATIAVHGEHAFLNIFALKRFGQRWDYVNLRTWTQDASEVNMMETQLHPFFGNSLHMLESWWEAGEDSI